MSSSFSGSHDKCITIMEHIRDFDFSPSMSNNCFISVQCSSAPTPQNESNATLPCCARFKHGLPVFGEIYETEDTKPRLLIKIIHFGQSWPGGKQKLAAAAIDSFLSSSLFCSTFILSIFSLSFTANSISNTERKREWRPGCHSYLLNHFTTEG